MKRFFVVFIAVVLLMVSCGSDDKDGKSFSIVVKGFIGTNPTTFSGGFIKLGADGGWSGYTVTGDSTIIDLGSGGTYIVNAQKAGYIASPAMDTVQIDSDGGRGDAIFYFSRDTAAVGYSLRISGYIDGNPTAFDAQYKLNTAGSWQDVSVGSIGYTSLEIETPGTYFVRASKDGYSAVPEIDTVVISTTSRNGSSRFDFVDTTGTGHTYRLNIIGEIDGIRTNFTAKYRHQADPWRTVAVGASGITSVDVDLTGTYFVQAEKEGYSASPEIDTVVINDDNRIGYSRFAFTDTTTSPVDYSITIIGERGGSPLSFDAEYSSDGSTWTDVSVGSTGQQTIELSAGGTYQVRASHSTCSVAPAMVTLNLSDSNPADTARFEFTDTSETTPYWLHYIGETDGIRTSFTGFWRQLGGVWHSVSVDGSGTRSVNLPALGAYEVYAQKEGNLAYPVMDTIEITSSRLYAYSVFEFVDTSGPARFEITISGRIGSEPTDFTAEYRLNYPGYDWQTLAIGTSGTETVSLPAPGEYFVKATKPGYHVSPSQRSLTLNDDRLSGEAQFSFIDTAGSGETFVTEIYIADLNNHRLARINDMSGAGWQSYGSRGSGIGQLHQLFEMDFDVYGRIYLGDKQNRRVVRIDDMSGAGWTTFGTSGTGVGQFSQPQKVNIGPCGRIFVLDLQNNRFVRFDDMTGAGWVSFEHPMILPQGLLIDDSGIVYISDTNNHRLLRFDGESWTIFGTRGSGAGQFYHPIGIAQDRYGRFYITDGHNHRIVRMDDFHGSGWVTFGTRGSGIGELNHPYGIDVTPDGVIYFADGNNHRIVKIDDMTGSGWQTFGTFGSGPGQFDHTRGIRLRYSD